MQIQQLCERIAREFTPEKIILFGSYAYGKPTPVSDLDLLVVMQFDGDPLEKAVAMLNQLNVLLPIDLLVRTPEQIQYRLEMGDRFIRDIVARGKVMYDAHHREWIEKADGDRVSAGRKRTILHSRPASIMLHSTAHPCNTSLCT